MNTFEYKNEKSYLERRKFIRNFLRNWHVQIVLKLQNKE